MGEKFEEGDGLLPGLEAGCQICRDLTAPTPMGRDGQSFWLWPSLVLALEGSTRKDAPLSILPRVQQTAAQMDLGEVDAFMDG